MKHIFTLLFIFIVSLNLQAADLKPYIGDIQSEDFELTDLQGKTHRLDNYRGKVVLLNFWATWCPPCIEELPSLTRLQNHFKSQSVDILTIDVGEPIELITPFLEKTSSTDLTVLLDSDGSVHKKWNIYVFPTTFLLDQDGEIRYAAVGALDWGSQPIIDIINNLLQEN